MMIFFVNNTKRQYVYAGEAEGESISEIFEEAGWNCTRENIIMVTDVERYENRGYRDVVESDSSSEPSESESESEVDTSDEIEAFMDSLRRRDSEETLTDTTTWSLP
jgi:hypothetical protein